MKLNMEVIRLVTAVTALFTVIAGLSQACINSSKLKVQKAQIEDLHVVAAAVAVTLTIDAPREREVIRVESYEDMHGRYVGELPVGHRLWVLARDQYNYFLMYPPTQVTPTMRHWSQTNVILATPGRWELHVCVVDEAASRWLENRANSRDWSGFPSLPEGIRTVRYVTVQKE